MKTKLETLHSELAEWQKRQSTLTGAAASIAADLAAAKKKTDIPSIARLRGEEAATTEALNDVLAGIAATQAAIADQRAADAREALWGQLNRLREHANGTREKANKQIAEMNRLFSELAETMESESLDTAANTSGIQDALGLDAVQFQREATARQADQRLVPLVAYDAGGEVGRSLSAHLFHAGQERAQEQERQRLDAAQRAAREREIEREREMQARREKAAAERIAEERLQADADARRAAIDAEYARRAAKVLSHA